jgi:energy-coupling factor transporter ATP-binding protein EcfA2
MGIVRMVAEGIGPFENLVLDFSDGKGKPHLGPHILAGVNGSGKSTILKAIAWVLANENSGFPIDEWRHILRNPGTPRASLEFASPQHPPFIQARAGSEGKWKALESWARGHWRALASQRTHPDVNSRHGLGDRVTIAPPVPQPFWVQPVAYALGEEVGFLAAPEIGAGPTPYERSLAFGSTIDNRAVQAWLLGLDYRRLGARNRNELEGPYQEMLDRLQSVLRLVCDKDVRLEFDTTLPRPQPRIRVDGVQLNFSQLSAGVRHTFGWIADFMRRLDQGSPKATDTVLLLDEIDAHLHPQWQRLLLPAIKRAFPKTQIIVSSHSPFVISSCPHAVVHVLKVNDNGTASLDHRQEAPFGSSVMATLGDIFGVESRFDVETEKQLDEWDKLKQGKAAGKLSSRDSKRLDELTMILSQRSEELHWLVSPGQIPDSVVASILARKENGKPKSTRHVAAGRRPSR